MSDEAELAACVRTGGGGLAVTGGTMSLFAVLLVVLLAAGGGIALGLRSRRVAKAGAAR